MGLMLGSSMCGIQKHNELQVWRGSKAAEKLIQVDNSVHQSKRSDGRQQVGLEWERTSECQFHEEFGFIEETEGTIDAAVVREDGQH